MKKQLLTYITGIQSNYSKVRMVPSFNVFDELEELKRFIGTLPEAEYHDEIDMRAYQREMVMRYNDERTITDNL